MHALNKMPYAPLDSARVDIHDGVIFLTYASLAASSDAGLSRLQQLIDWAGMYHYPTTTSSLWQLLYVPGCPADEPECGETCCSWMQDSPVDSRQPGCLTLYPTAAPLQAASTGRTRAEVQQYFGRLTGLVIFHLCTVRDPLSLGRSSLAGKDFDGLVVFDESHKAKNLVPEAGSKPTKVGAKVMELQQRLPKARVVYCSATGGAPINPDCSSSSGSVAA